MKTRLSIFCLSLCAGILLGEDATNTNGTDWVPLVLKFPSAAFVGTPKVVPAGSTVDTMDKPEPTIQIPRDVHNIAPKAKITCSDKNITRADLAKLTDGDKESENDSIVQLRKGQQWVQFDFGSSQELYAIAVWHAHDTQKICRAVIVQVADDQDFTDNVRTLFNNDRENSLGQGVGTNRQYFETFRGKTINARGAKAQYVRLYSDGSTESKLNEYTEVEIYGRPAK